MKVVGLMLASTVSSDRGPENYTSMVNACKETWHKTVSDDVKVFSVFGNTYKSHLLEGTTRNEVVFDEDDLDIIVNTWELRTNILRKSVKGMEFLLNNYEFDYLFRPNCGSYVNTANLLSYLEDKPRDRYYDGMMGNTTAIGSSKLSCVTNDKGKMEFKVKKTPIPFCSGACTLYSRDVVELIVQNQDGLEYDGVKRMDDAFTGIFLNSVGVQPHELQGQYTEEKRKELTNVKNHVQKRIIAKSSKELQELFLPNVFHYYFGHTLNPNLIHECHSLFGFEVQENFAKFVKLRMS